MNILKRELKMGLKPFLFWTLGIFILVYVGIVKYEGFSGGNVDITELLAQFPRAVLAVVGIAGVDINTLSGYTAILTYYALICAVIYAVSLGSGAVIRESVDRTYEFVFTRPRTRGHVLAMKLLSSWIYLLLLCAAYVVFCTAATASIETTENIRSVTLLSSLSILLVGTLFIALSAFLSAASRRPEKGALLGNMAFLCAFVLGIVYDMLENGGALRLISPFKYFLPSEIIDGTLSAWYVALTAILTAGLLILAFRRFCRRDLT